MSVSDLKNPASLLESPSANADLFPLAKSGSGDSFISQIPAGFSANTYSHPVQVPRQAAAHVLYGAQHGLPAGAQVLEKDQVVILPDGRLVLLPQAPETQPPVHPYVPPHGALPPNQQSMINLQKILSSRNMSLGQTDNRHQHQVPHPSDAYQYPQMGLGQPFQDPFVQTDTTCQPGTYNVPIGFGRSSASLKQRHESASFTPGNRGENQGTSDLRQSAQCIPHPDDGHYGRGSRGRRDFHSWASNRGQRIQNYVEKNNAGRHASGGDNWRAQSQSTSFTSTNGCNNQQDPPVAPSQTSTTPHFSHTGSFANRQQQPFIHDMMAKTNQQQIATTPVAVADASSRRAFEEGLIQATLALQLEDAAAPGGHAVDDTTRQPPITDNNRSATAPSQRVYQAPMLRSRKGQSMVGLNGSPIRRPSQPLTIDPIKGPPPAFYPQFTPAVVSTSTIPSTAPSVSETQHRSEAGQSWATSVSPRTGEPHTAQGMTYSSDRLVTPIQQHFVRNQIAQVATLSTQIAPYQMPPNQIAPWPMALYQPSGSVSRHLSIIAPGGKKPSIEVACDTQNLPFVELLSRAQPSNGNGVVRLSNIPYSTTRSEIVAFLGRNASLVEDKFEPIHIIMDRVSGKTLDAYVEFKDMASAVKAVDRQVEVHRDGNKGGRLGNRFVTVEVSSLESMMRALFPKATNVIWHGMVPDIIPLNPNNPEDRYSTGFKGFINPEELVLLVKHVQDPNRIHFSEKCPQRPFECMISTIVKYPWFMAGCITIGDRDEIFQAALAIVKGLLQRMSEEDIHLNSRLLKKMTRAIFNCPGFQESQKDDLAFIIGVNPYSLDPPLAPYADHWYVFKTIGPKPGAQEDVLKYYIALLREATTSMNMTTLSQRQNMWGPDPPSSFGNINIQYPPNVKFMTFAQVKEIEWGVIENLLRKSLAME